MPTVSGFINSVFEIIDLSQDGENSGMWGFLNRATGVPDSSGSNVTTQSQTSLYSRILCGGNLGFNIPQGSTITSATLNTRARITSGAGPTRISNGYFGIDPEQYLFSFNIQQNLNTNYNIISAQIPLDGLSLLIPIINSTGFYIGLDIEALTGAATISAVDAMWLTVTYTEPPSNEVTKPFYKTSSVLRNAGKFLKY